MIVKKMFYSYESCLEKLLRDGYKVLIYNRVVFPSYFISPVGEIVKITKVKDRVRGIDVFRIKQPSISYTKDGRKKLNIMVKGKSTCIQIHRAVYECFVSPTFKGDLMFKDGDDKNCHYTNLISTYDLLEFYQKYHKEEE